MRTNATVFYCRVFMSKTSFNKDGYSNWKNARGAEGGFKSHENDEHNQAMKLWDDRNNRDKSSSTITHKIANKPEHRQWLETVFLMIKALVTNGQPLHGARGIHRLWGRCFRWIIFELNE